MNTAFIPNPIDESTRLEGTAGDPKNNVAETLITKTATFAGTALDLGVGAPNAGIGQPMAALVKSTNVKTSATDETYSFVLQDSPDNSTWTSIGPAVAMTAAGKLSVPGFRTQRYVRVNLTIGGTSPTITYEAWLTSQGFPRT